MTRDELDIGVREILATVLARPILPHFNVLRSSEPNWDSLRHIDLILSIEDHFDVQFPEDRIAALDSVHSIVNALADCLETRHSH